MNPTLKTKPTPLSEPKRSPNQAPTLDKVHPSRPKIHEAPTNPIPSKPLQQDKSYPIRVPSSPVLSKKDKYLSSRSHTPSKHLPHSNSKPINMTSSNPHPPIPLDHPEQPEPPSKPPPTSKIMSPPPYNIKLPHELFARPRQYSLSGEHTSHNTLTSPIHHSQARHPLRVPSPPPRYCYPPRFDRFGDPFLQPPVKVKREPPEFIAPPRFEDDRIGDLPGYGIIIDDLFEHSPYNPENYHSFGHAWPQPYIGNYPRRNMVSSLGHHQGGYPPFEVPVWRREAPPPPPPFRCYDPTVHPSLHSRKRSRASSVVIEELPPDYEEKLEDKLPSKKGRMM